LIIGFSLGGTIALRLGRELNIKTIALNPGKIWKDQ
jgi:esterase/lipase